ncbi:MDR family MFS transporter [Streptomyces sp. NPDC048441]|uniref:MDR family MFS transporter n=1 Tax=Streptomyces sp. NPDC048441 TaxID=3365552 RepID=UPI003720E42D
MADGTNESAATATQPGGGPDALSLRQIRLVVVGVLAGVLLSALDQTIVSTALPRIVGDIGGINGLAWVVTGYLLTSMAATPLWGKFSDLYGRRQTFQAAIGIFIIGSALCGASQNITELVIFRAVQGIGAGGLYALALAIIGAIVPPELRGRYQGYFVVVYGISSVAGPLVGGWLADGPGWRWIFYVNVPVGLAPLIITTLVLKLEKVRREHRVDYVGAALVVAVVTSLLLYVDWAGDKFGWTDARALLLLAAFAVFTAILLWVEPRAAEPIIPMSLFRNQVFSMAMVFSFMSGAAMFSGTVYLPVYLQAVQGMSPVRAGLAMLPAMVGIGLTSMVSGAMISKTGKYKIFPVAGSAVVVVASLLLALLDTDTPYWEFALISFVFGGGVGATMQTIITAVQNSVDPKEIGVATGSVNFFQRMGAAVGTAVLGAVLSVRLAHHLADGPEAAGATRVDANDVEAIKGLAHGLRDFVTGAYADSIDDVFLASVPFAVLAFGTSLFLKELRPQAPAEQPEAVAEHTTAPASDQ